MPYNQPSRCMGCLQPVDNLFLWSLSMVAVLCCCGCVCVCARASFRLGPYAFVVCNLPAVQAGWSPQSFMSTALLWALQPKRRSACMQRIGYA